MTGHVPDNLLRRLDAHPDVEDGERVRVNTELALIRVARRTAILVGGGGGFVIGFKLAMNSVLPAWLCGTIAVALSVACVGASYFGGGALERWRLRRALRTADARRALAEDAVSASGAPFAVPSARAAPLLTGLASTEESVVASHEPHAVRR